MGGPLEGVRIVELGTMIAVPAATQLLTAQGARVLKVEDTTIGDPLRFYGSKKNGMSGWFAVVNAGKRSIGIDLAHESGKDVLWRLLAATDVFIQGFRPGVIDRLGFPAALVLERHPQLIYVSSSGFGLDGPFADRPTFDPLIQATAGWAGAQTVDGVPTLIKGFVADKVAALTTAQAITAALVARGVNGKGQHLEASMFEANVAFNWPDVMMHTTLLDDDAAHEPNVLRAYQLFPSRDGWVSVTAGTDGQWQAVCDALDRPELARDARFIDAAARSADFEGWYRVFGEMCSAFSSAELLARCEQADVPAAPVLDPTEVASHDQVVARDAVPVVEHPVVGRMYIPRQGVRFADAPAPGDLSAAPTHGEHGDAVLAELGFDAAEVAELRQGGVIV